MKGSTRRALALVTQVKFEGYSDCSDDGRRADASDMPSLNSQFDLLGRLIDVTEVRQRAKAALMNHIQLTTEASPTAKQPRGAERSRRRKIGIGVFAAAAASIALVATGINLDRSSGVRGPEAAGAAALMRLSETAESTDVPGSGEIMYSKSVGNYVQTSIAADGASTESLEHVVREVWVSPDRTWTLREENNGKINTEHFGRSTPDSLFYDNSADLPEDFNALKPLLTDRAKEGGHSRNGELFTLATDALRETMAGKQLRSSLFRVVAEIPGVAALGDTPDLEGRIGLGFRYTEKDGSYQEAIFDPNSSAMLGFRWIAQNGTVMSDTANLTIERVTEVPESVLAEARAQATERCGDPTGCVGTGNGFFPASTYEESGN